LLEFVITIRITIPLSPFLEYAQETLPNGYARSNASLAWLRVAGEEGFSRTASIPLRKSDWADCNSPA
jgi:hypothetical protein